VDQAGDQGGKTVSSSGAAVVRRAAPRRRGGNPFFVQQLALLAPSGVAEVLSRQVARLPVQAIGRRRSVVRPDVVADLSGDVVADLSGIGLASAIGVDQAAGVLVPPWGPVTRRGMYRGTTRSAYVA